MDEFDDPTIWEGLVPPLTPKPTVQSAALRTKPKRESTSITQNVGAEYPTPAQPTGTPPTGTPPTGAAQSRATLGQQAWGDIEKSQAEIDRLSGPQDYTAMQDYAKQRAEGGQKSLLLALAAQHAGKEYAPVSAAYLKRAMEAREPVKTATGFIDETGQHIEDPQARAQQQIKIAEARIARSQQIIQSNAAAEEKERAQNDLIRSREEIARGNQELRAIALGQAASNRADREADKQAAADTRRIDQIRREYNGRLAKVQDGAQFANQVASLASDPNILRNPQAQVSLMMQFGKMLDPTSVVREAEQQMILKARAPWETLINTPERLLSGQLLTAKQIREISALAAEYQRMSTGQKAALDEHYTNIAARNKLPPEDIVFGYKPAAPAAAPAAGTAGNPIKFDRRGAAPAGKPATVKVDF